MSPEPPVLNNGNHPKQIFAPLANAVSCLFGRIIPAFFIVFGLLFSAIGIGDIKRGRSSETWPRTAGTVIHSEVQRNVQRVSGNRPGSGSTSITTYRVHVRYAYTIGGERFEGSRVRFGGLSYGQRSEALQHARLYPVGKEVWVYYDPDNPSTSTLIRGTAGSPWVFVVVGGAFALMGASLFFYLPKILARKPRQTEVLGE